MKSLKSNGFVYPPLKIFPSPKGINPQKLLRFRKGLRGMSNDADVDAALEQVAAVFGNRDTWSFNRYVDMCIAMHT